MIVGGIGVCSGSCVYLCATLCGALCVGTAIDGSRFSVDCRVTKCVNATRQVIVGAAAELQSASLILFFLFLFYLYTITRLVNDRNREIDTMPLFSYHIRSAISGEWLSILRLMISFRRRRLP